MCTIKEGNMRLYLFVALVLWILSYIIGENIVVLTSDLQSTGLSSKEIQDLVGMYWQSNPVLAMLALAFLVAGLIPSKKKD